MKRNANQTILTGLLLCFCFSTSVIAQTETWDYRYGSVTVMGGEKIYSSPNPKNNPADAHLTKEMLYKITYGDVVKMNDINYRGGIKATFNTDGGASVRVYLYDPNQPDGKGPIIFGCSRNIYGGLLPVVEAPDEIDLRVNSISQEGPAALRPPDKPGNWMSDNIKALFASWARTYAKNSDGSPYNPSNGPINGLKNAFCYVVIELKITNATIHNIRIPGLGTFAPFDIVFRPQKKITDVQTVFNNPASYPNWLFVMAHRGYFRDVPENSQQAMRLAAAVQMPAVEIDVRLTKDSVWVMSHDDKLGQTRRTTMPQRLMNHPAKNENGEIPISELTICELRPDLCPEGAGHFGWTQPDQYEPVWLSQPEGQEKIPIATMEEVFLMAKNKVLVDVDKVDGGPTKAQSRFDLVYKLLKKTGMDSMVITKGIGFNWPDPIKLKDSFPDIDWRKLWYTPIYFADKLTPDLATNKAWIDAWTNPLPGWQCPGIELVYMQKDDKAYQLIDYIKNTKQKHVIEFPMWPEYCEHMFVDPRTDHRSSINWLLDKNTIKRPTCIISDRFDVVIDLLKESGLQNAGSLNW